MEKSSTINLHLIFAVFMIFGLSHLTSGQNEENTKDMYVTVKVEDDEADYKVYSGYISGETDSKYLVLTVNKSKKIRIPFDNIISMDTERSKEIEKIKDADIEEDDHENDEYEEEDEDEYGFDETGFFIALGPDISIETSDFVELFRGAELSVGHKFSRLLAIGGGISYRDYTYDLWPSGVAQVFADVRGFFLRRNTSPYYRIKVGYGDSISGNGNYEGSKGGLYFSPAIGLRMLGGSMFQLNLETGLNHQQITYLNTDFGSIERKYTFNRHYFGLTLMY